MNLNQRLQEAGFARQRIEVERHATALLLRKLVREADKAGWRKTEIAAAADVSRQTVHEMLKD